MTEELLYLLNDTSMQQAFTRSTTEENRLRKAFQFKQSSRRSGHPTCCRGQAVRPRLGLGDKSGNSGLQLRMFMLLTPGFRELCVFKHRNVERFLSRWTSLA